MRQDREPTRLLHHRVETSYTSLNGTGASSVADTYAVTRSVAALKDLTLSFPQSGIVVGALIGTPVLSFDTRAGYLALVLLYGCVCFFFGVLVLRVPHVTSLRDRRVRHTCLFSIRSRGRAGANGGLVRVSCPGRVHEEGASW